MNSRSSVNETNLVNFSAELSTLNQLDAKDGLLSFPFDHIYACHSQSSERRQPLLLEKEVEVSTHCVTTEEKKNASSSDVTRLSEQLTVSENQNKKLKDLLIYHLDLIQQQNELISKRDKLYQTLKQENDTLKAKLIRMDRRVGLSQRHTVNPPLYTPTSTITSGILKNEQGASHIMLNSFTELLLPDKGNSCLFDNNKPFGQGTFGIARTTRETEVPNYASGDIKVPAFDKKHNCDNYKMIDNKRSIIKKEVKTENRAEALYTVTSNSGTPVIQRIQRNRRRTSGIGSLSRMSKTPKTQPTETTTSKNKTNTDPTYDRSYSVNKKSKMINTYGKSRNSSITKRTSQFTGSLSDRLRLIDTTPTGEDPYQLGEADMREQSPIPKLMLQKTNHGRMKICSESGETSRRIYDLPDTKTKLNRFMSAYEQAKKDPEKTMMFDEPPEDMLKGEPEIDWRMFSDKPVNESSLCDFAFGETNSNLSSIIPSLDANEFQELFTSDAALNLDNLNQLDYPTEKLMPEKTKRRNARTTSLISPTDEEGVEIKRGTPSTRGRKRAFSAISLGKQSAKGPAKPRATRGKAATRGKRSPVPGMMTNKPYPTLVGDKDLSWYFGLDPDLKLEDVDPPADSQASTVEVPRWREKPYTSCYTLEGTENVDDKVFEKRHQKLEAEERRQLRWHMRRIREQRHVERLRLRQRDSWSSTVSAPSVYSVWPRPQQDARFIEITSDLPVTGFGEPLPKLPESDFMLPWVRTSKALKRSKRSKTLH
ncbi:uncharacterized protein LOC124543248 isoform X1 [Vanessa cardui]|uniref:uncharacterized protein LOC124543248 isoform X1 n=1 Tax=Vanessa cardui TaxID=171605 RepID=UPI001F1409A8|nr:uncharacterized protein LOC124543248 isoform X1 [Vanessa cardui]